MAERYSDTALEHFMNPRNIGAMDNPDGVGRIGDAIHAVLGGLHRRDTSEHRMSRTVAALDSFHIHSLMPCRCTGQAAVDLLKRQFGDRCLSHAKNGSLTL